MSLAPERDAELRTLLQQLSDEQLTPDDARRLNDLLHGDPAACELYLDHVTLDAQLRQELGGQRAGDVLPFKPTATPAGRSTTLRRWALGIGRFAAAVLLGAGLVLGYRAMQEQPVAKVEEPEARPAADCVATLLFADHCQWGKRVRPVEGQRLGVGAMHLEKGLALLRFDDGAAVVVEGPTELALESRGAARLLSGRLTVRAPDEAAGFMVRTPTREVVDLGTEFAVVVEPNGATELHVLEGEVTYGKPGTPEEMAELLTAGKAVRFDTTKEDAHAVPLNAPRFSELLRQAKIGPREDLLLAHEPFNYPLGQLPLVDANGGTGWGGPWRLSPGAKRPAGDLGDMSIVSGKLTIPWPIQGGRGPMLEAAPGYQSRSRPLAQPVRLDEDGVYYLSVLTRWATPEGSTNPSVRMVLRSSTNFQGDHVMFNLPGSQRPQLDIRNGAIFTSAQTVQPNETQFWVGKIVARKHGEDEVFFRIYEQGETLDLVEPATWSVRSRGVRSDAQLDLLLLTQMGPGTCWWDEVRIGKSWRAVVPTAPIVKK